MVTNDKSMPDNVYVFDGGIKSIGDMAFTRVDPKENHLQYTRTQAIVELLEWMAQDAPLMNYSEDDYNAGFAHGLHDAIQAIKEMK